MTAIACIGGYNWIYRFLFKKFIKLKSGMLEIRSKSTNIKSIKKINPSHNIIPAFSLNPEHSIKSHEA